MAALATTAPPRQRVIDAAIACFARSGFHGASMQEICAEAGMSPGALYRYFPSKVSIIAAIADAQRVEHAAFFERMAEADDPVEALASIGIDTLEACTTGPTAALAAETMAEAIRNPEVRGTFRRNIDEAQSAVVDALHRGQAAGAVDPALDVEAACALIMALGDGLAVHRALNPGTSNARIRPVLQTLLRRFLRPAVALLLLLVAPAFGKPAYAAAPEPRPPAVTVVAATTGPIVATAILTGTLVPREEVLVSPQLEGLAITSIDAEEGDAVAAGQVLAHLARDVLDATAAQNEASLARADAAVAQARSAIVEAQANKVQVDLALARTRDLLSGGNASREVFEQRQAAAQMATARLDANANLLRAAEADRKLAEAQRRELQVRLGRTELRAPVAGIVSRRTARLGAVVMGAGEPLFRIIEAGAVELEADVPETLLARLRPGQPAQVETAGGTRPGRVRLVSPEVNRATRLGRVRVAVDADGPSVAGPSGSPVVGPNGPPVIGSFARAVVETARRDGLVAPLSAVLFQPDGPVVQVVRDGVVSTRRVEVGLRAGKQAEITRGLTAGEEVVATSGTFIRGGDRVTPVRGDGLVAPVRGDGLVAPVRGDGLVTPVGPGR